MKNRYSFSVNAVLIYNVEAKTEEEAHNLLIEKGGLDITRDDILVDKEDYERAELILEEKI
jgi:transcriptional/translational regulatory protein YebC/TACO1|tara:strand:- start:74 stop:256 length:183 start_codon:yes stop_codon:yes gene_type:complete